MFVRASSGSGGGSGSINPDVQYESTTTSDSASSKTFPTTSGKTYIINGGIRGTSIDKDNFQITSGETAIVHTQFFVGRRQDGYYDYSDIIIFKATSSSVTVACTKSGNPTITGFALIQLD